MGEEQTAVPQDQVRILKIAEGGRAPTACHVGHGGTAVTALLSYKSPRLMPTVLPRLCSSAALNSPGAAYRGFAVRTAHVAWATGSSWNLTNRIVLLIATWASYQGGFG